MTWSVTVLLECTIAKLQVTFCWFNFWNVAFCLCTVITSCVSSSWLQLLTWKINDLKIHSVCCWWPFHQLPSGLVYSTWEMSKGTFWLSSINVISNLDKIKATLRSLGTSSIQHCWDSRQRCVWHLIVRRRDAKLWKQLNSFFSIMLQTIQWFVPIWCTALWNQV